MNEISVTKLNKMPQDSYVLVDVRSESLADYGMMPGAIWVSAEDIEKGNIEKIENIPADKKIVFYCFKWAAIVMKELTRWIES